MNADDYVARFRAAYAQVDRAYEGRGGFDWSPGWTPGPLAEFPVTVYPPYTTRRPAPDTRADRASSLIDALLDVEIGPADGEVIAWLATVADTPITATIVSLIHRARLAGPIPGRQRPAPGGGR